MMGGREAKLCSLPQFSFLLELATTNKETKKQTNSSLRRGKK